MPVIQNVFNWAVASIQSVGIWAWDATVNVFKFILK